MPRLPTIRVIGSQAISTRPSLSVLNEPILSCVEVMARLLLPLRECQWWDQLGRVRRAVPTGGDWRALPGLAVAGGQLAPLRAPLRFLVQALRGDVAQLADDPAVRAAGRAGDLAAGRGVHERHELVGEAGHGAADADAADVGAAADAVDPAALGHVALDHGSPAPQLDQAGGLPVLGGELALLVVAAPVTALVHGGAEQPAWPEPVVQRD